MYEWYFSMWKSKTINAVDAITNQTAKNSGNNAFRRKRTSKKAAQNIVIGLEVGKKVRLTFWRRKGSMRGKFYVFSSYKQR